MPAVGRLVHQHDSGVDIVCHLARAAERGLHIELLRPCRVDRQRRQQEHDAPPALRHADDAAQAARQARLAGHVSVGLAPSTSAVLALPLMQAMRERYPDVRLRMVESLSGNLAAMLGARQLDLAVLFETETARRLSVSPLLDERLFLIGRRDLPGLPTGRTVRIARLSATYRRHRESALSGKVSRSQGMMITSAHS